MSNEMDFQPHMFIDRINKLEDEVKTIRAYSVMNSKLNQNPEPQKEYELKLNREELTAIKILTEKEMDKSPHFKPINIKVLLADSSKVVYDLSIKVNMLLSSVKE